MKNFANKFAYPNFITCAEFAQELREKNEQIRNSLKDNLKLTFFSGDKNWDASYIKGLQKDCNYYNIDLTIEEGFHPGIIPVCSSPFLISSKIKNPQINHFIDTYADGDLDNVLGLARDKMTCTATAAYNYLKANNFYFLGKRICIIGRGDNVGYSLAKYLIKYESATVTVCNSHTPFIYDIIDQSDLIITAIDKINYFDMTGVWSPIIDIGLGLGEDGKLHGNVIENTICDNIDFCATGVNTIGLLTREELINRVLNYYVEGY